MYKPIPQSLENLQGMKEEVMTKIKNSPHLDSIAMGHLYNQLKDLNAKIEEAKREEVGNGH